jgi:hypothetical protein
MSELPADLNLYALPPQIPYSYKEVIELSELPAGLEFAQHFLRNCGFSFVKINLLCAWKFTGY